MRQPAELDDEGRGGAAGAARERAARPSKVLPHHATREGTVQACRESLRRLNTSWIDLHLLHWRGPVQLAETLEAFSDLRNAGLIRNWGVSDFDVSDLDDLMSSPGSSNVAIEQVLYNLSRRGPEFDLFPACRELGIPIMAYSPVEQGRILGNPVLRDIATQLDASLVQVALAWVLRLDNICAIPRSGRPELLRVSGYTRWVRVPKLTVSPAQEKFCQTARRWLLDSTTMLSLPS